MSVLNICTVVYHTCVLFTATHSRVDLCEYDVRISTQHHSLHHSLLLDPERTLQEAAGLDQGETTKGKVGCERSQKTNLQGVQATKQHLVYSHIFVCINL